jgi:hypothetical protein
MPRCRDLCRILGARFLSEANGQLTTPRERKPAITHRLKEHGGGGSEARVIVQLDRYVIHTIKPRGARRIEDEAFRAFNIDFQQGNPIKSRSVHQCRNIQALNGTGVGRDGSPQLTGPLSTPAKGPVRKTQWAAGIPDSRARGRRATAERLYVSLQHREVAGIWLNRVNPCGRETSEKINR